MNVSAHEVLTALELLDLADRRFNSMTRSQSSRLCACREARLLDPVDPPAGQGVYFIAIETDADVFVKIGVSSDVKARVAKHQESFPFPLHLLAVRSGGTFADEAEYHCRFQASRQRGEWFCLSPQLLEEIKLLRALYAA